MTLLSLYINKIMYIGIKYSIYRVILFYQL